MPFELDFPITRPFPWPHFTRNVLTVSALVLAGFTLLNVRLVGFETITRLEDDFNFTQSFWLDRMIPKALLHGKNLCQPFVLKMGDSFVTNSSIFLWNVELVANANHSSSESSLVYRGSTLQDCDIIAIYLTGTMNPPTTDIVAVVSCKDLDGFDVITKTAFPVSVLPGTYTRFSGFTRLSSFSSIRQALAYQLITISTWDLRRHVDAMIMFNQSHYQGSLSAEISYTPCPASLGTDAPCANNPPPINITSALLILFNDTSSAYLYNSSAIIEYGLYESVANIVQTIHAAVEIDLGNFQKNNFLVNPSLLSQTLYSQFPSSFLPEPTVSYLYQSISEENVSTIPNFVPYKVEGPAKLEARYLCQVQQLKEPAQATIAVLVATLSMFLSGWGLFMLLSTYWAKRGNNLANSCIAHDNELDPIQDIELGPIQLPQDGLRVPLLPVA